MIPRAIAVGVLFVGLGRALAQMPTDAAAAVALTAEQEKAMAGQARSVSHAAVSAVFGAAPGAAAAPAASAPAAPAAAAPADVAPADAPAAASVPAALPVDRMAADGVPAGGAPPVGTAPAAAALAERGRDPFRPFTLDLRPETRENEILTPLQRYELPQLRLAGVVLELKPPRAMLQDNSGMGYIITPGTPIGRRRGVVKSIEPRRVVVEEHVIDYYGREQTQQVVIEMAKDDKPQSAGQE